jgi:hypothetical protein
MIAMDLVPADPSSSIPAAWAQLADALRPADTPGLLVYLATIHDPRRACGRRHPLVAILAMAAAARWSASCVSVSTRAPPPGRSCRLTRDADA